jgi:hypothetical protein
MDASLSHVVPTGKERLHAILVCREKDRMVLHRPAHLPMQSVSDFTRRFNAFLYRANIQKLGASDRATAKEWCVALIRREHPKLADEEIERFYENLISVRWTAVDEWSERMN